MCWSPRASGSLRPQPPQQRARIDPEGIGQLQDVAQTDFGFQGSYGTASGLDYMVNRYYTPTTDQFLSVDPDLAKTGQPYAFTNDDPLNMADPLGLVPGKYYWNNTTWNKYQGTKYTYLCVGNQIHCGGPSCHGGPCVPSSSKVNWAALPAYASAVDNWDKEVNAAGAAFQTAEARTAAIQAYECYGGPCTQKENLIDQYQLATSYAELGQSLQAGEELADAAPFLTALSQATGEALICGGAGVGGASSAQSWSNEATGNGLRSLGFDVSDETIWGLAVTGGAAVVCKYDLDLPDNPSG